MKWLISWQQKAHAIVKYNNNKKNFQSKQKLLTTLLREVFQKHIKANKQFWEKELEKEAKNVNILKKKFKTNYILKKKELDKKLINKK